MGNTEETIERAKQALRFSPFDSLNFRANSAMSIAHFYSGRYVVAFPKEFFPAAALGARRKFCR